MIDFGVQGCSFNFVIGISWTLFFYGPVHVPILESE